MSLVKSGKYGGRIFCIHNGVVLLAVIVVGKGERGNGGRVPGWLHTKGR